MIARAARLPPALCRPAFAGLLLTLMATGSGVAQDFNLPATHQRRPMLIPGLYACVDGKVPTSQFEILDGTAYFLRGATIRAGDFAYDKATSIIDWKSGPFAQSKITGYNTTRLADKKPVIILHFEDSAEFESTEYCTIVE
jgi:hypothetical protein